MSFNNVSFSKKLLVSFAALIALAVGVQGLGAREGRTYG